MGALDLDRRDIGFANRGKALAARVGRRSVGEKVSTAKAVGNHRTAAAVLSLLSDASDWITGQVTHVAGGHAL